MPLALSRLEEGSLRWPGFLERYFTVPVAFRHAIWAVRQAIARAAWTKNTREPGSGVAGAT